MGVTTILYVDGSTKEFPTAQKAWESLSWVTLKGHTHIARITTPAGTYTFGMIP